jgi:subtilase family serine protease
MTAAYMAPGLSKVMVYEGSNPNDILNRMATDNLAQQLSSSWGFSPINATTEQIFKQYIAQGQSFFQASGDSGAYKGSIMSPSDDPNVTVVGGASLTTAGQGGPWQSESTWSGSGGGISTTYPIPSYQQGLNMAANGGSATMRNIPDVALTAAVQMFLIQSNGHAVAVGGTSAAAPLQEAIERRTAELAAANQRLHLEIAERKRAEEALRKQASLLDLAHDAILVRDMNGNIAFWNPGAEESYGWPAQEALGKSAYELLGSEYPGGSRTLRRP